MLVDRGGEWLAPGKVLSAFSALFSFPSSSSSSQSSSKMVVADVGVGA
jgi:hypothetical protein